jgi:acetylxylan esterase
LHPFARRARARVLSLSLSLVGVLGSARAHAATLEQVDPSVWGNAGLPSYVNMYVYVPDQLATKPPIVVAAHYCTGTGPAYFGGLTSMVSAANSQGFIMIFPEATGRNCWDVGSAASLTHDGGGDTHAIAQMVRYAIATYDADPTRVYVLGTSSGAMMTQALLGVYPDLFRAGAEFSGVPCGCWSVGYSGDNGQWSVSCATGNVTKSAAEWGMVVRDMYPGYTGHRPRLQLWHGTNDDAINYANFGESIKQFTNLLDLSETPSSTEHPQDNYDRQVWKNSCGATVLEATTVLEGTHSLPFESRSVLEFFGLEQPGAPDPESSCSDSGAEDKSSGCGCHLGSQSQLDGAVWAGLAALSLALARRQKRRRR